MKKIFLLSFLALTLMSCGKHFITSDAYRNAVNAEFQQRKFMFNSDSVFNQKMSQLEREALQWMYASMPLADIIDYPGSYFLENIKYTFRAKDQMPWCDSIPEEIFRHFVMPVRVNNENLDDFRTTYYDTLAARVKGLSMAEAALEVNHWCHEQVTYRPTDGRTSSPMATMKTSFGRCGEESVLATAAMRTVGIPARQVYTPRWAHTDDNHAWIEVYVDGKWWFMGACEPEPVLNLAWFNAPVARAMLLHTSVFGDYWGKEDVITRTKCYTTINVVDGYLPTKRSTVTVVDTKGQPIEGAKVKFKIYNYAEFYTVAEVVSDKDGHAALTTGIGDLVVWATDGKSFGLEKLAAADTVMTLALNHQPNERFSVDIDVNPPKEGVIETDVTAEQIDANKVRLAYEDSIREAYMATFVTEEQSSNEDSRFADFLVASYGNHECLEQAWEKYTDRRDVLLNLLSSVSEKDLRDISFDVICDVLDNTPEKNDSLWINYVLCPRVEGEMLRPHRAYLSTLLNGKPTVDEVIKFVKNNVVLYDEYNPQRLRITPAGVGRTHMADTRSRNIFFVALCRAYGIPARLDLVTGKTQYFDNAWLDVTFDEIAEEPVASIQGKLSATYKPSAYLPNPSYYRHFTLAKIDACEERLLEFDEGENTELGAEASWATMLKDCSMLDTGYYMMTTGTRLANGGVLAHVEFFNIEEEQPTVVDMVMREEVDAVQVLGFINAETPVYVPCDAEETATLLSATGRGYFLLAILGDGDEPTNHAVRDLSYVSNNLLEWGRVLVFLSAKDNGVAKMKEKYAQFLSPLDERAVYGSDHQKQTLNMVLQALHVDHYSLPVIVIADSFGRVVYFSQGYNTSLGEQLKQVLSRL